MTRDNVFCLLVGCLIGWASARLVIPVPTIGYVSTRFVHEGPVRVRVPMVVNARWAIAGDKGTQCDPETGKWDQATHWLAGPAEVTCAHSDSVRLLVQGPAKDSRLIDPSVQAIPVPLPPRIPVPLAKERKP